MEKILSMLEEVMELDEGDLNADTVLDDIEEWDSIAKLSLMAEAKKNWKKTVTVDDINGFGTVRDICEFFS